MHAISFEIIFLVIKLVKLLQCKLVGIFCAVGQCEHCEQKTLYFNRVHITVRLYSPLWSYETQIQQLLKSLNAKYLSAKS